MNRLSKYLVFSLLLCSIVGTQQISAQTRTLSYQGSIASSDGTPVVGNREITVRFYSDANGQTEVWHDTYQAQIENGIFNLQLGSGAQPLPTSDVMSHAIWVGMQIAGGEELRPLTPLSASPFALSIADNSITKEKMATDYVGSIAINGQTVSSKGGAVNFVTGNGIEAALDPTTHTILLKNSSTSDLANGAKAQASNNYIINETSQETGASFNIDGSGAIGTTLTVGGASTFSGNMSITGSHTFSVGGNATVGGNTTVGGTLGVTGVTTTNGVTNIGDITTGTLHTTGVATLNSESVANNASVGGALAVAGATTTNGVVNTGDVSTGTLHTTGAATLNSASVTNNATVGGALTVAGTSVLGGNTEIDGVLTLDGLTHLSLPLSGILAVDASNHVGYRTPAEIFSTAAGNWILNQTTLQPAANFNISGSGAIGTTLNVGGTSTFGGALNMNSHPINYVADPASAQDAATKNYVDNAVSNEAAARIAGDNTLTTNLNNEITTRANEAATYLLLDGTRPMAGPLNMNSHAINNLASPVNAQDAATKSYVDQSSASPNYIHNGTSPQSGANFNIDGNGTVGQNLTVNGGLTELGEADINTSGNAPTVIGNSGGGVIQIEANGINIGDQGNPVIQIGNFGAINLNGQVQFNGGPVNVRSPLIVNDLVTINGQLNADQVNSVGGYELGGSAPAGHFLRGDGNNYVDGTIQADDLPSGSGSYIQNGTSPQSGSNFNIDGSGTVGQSLTVNGGLTELGEADINTSGNATTTIGNTYAGVVNIEANGINIGDQGNPVIQIGSFGGTNLFNGQVQFNGGPVNVRSPLIVNDQVTINGQLNADQVNSVGGYELGGTAPAGHFLRGDGNNYVDGTIQADDLPSGSGNYIQNGTSPQIGANFNIDGSGTAGGSVNVGVDYQIGGSTVLSDGGTRNVFAGLQAGASYTTGGDNAAFGNNALNHNTAADANTAIGSNAMANNTTAGWNVAVGANALTSQSFSNAGSPWTSGNVAVGVSALQNNQPTSASNGVQNTGAGTFVLESNTTGSDNTAFGYDAGQAGTPITTGSQNTLIGADAQVNNANAQNRTAIGFNAVATADNTIQLGNNSVTDVYTSGAIHSGNNLVALSGRGATYQASPAAPTGNSNSGNFEQMGLAGSITPNASGKVLITISGSVLNTSAGDGVYVGIDYGTGTAPANGVGIAGTPVGNQVLFTEPGTGTPIPVPFSTNAIVTGLTVGTTYWIDLIVVPVNGGTARVSQLSISAMEMP